MAIRQSPYDSLMSNINKNEDFSDAFGMIINNPYRILGASTYCDEAELRAIYEHWKSAPEKYKSKFDKTKLGAPHRTSENMEWALENADSYVYKIFWFSDADIASRLGNKGDFLEFFSKKRSVNTTDYNSFLVQYIFLCVFDRNFTLTEQWKILLNLINELLNVSVGRFWGFFSGNKIEAIDNNKMAFLYNEFKDNILNPIKEMINRQNGKVNPEEVIHIHRILSSVEKPQLPFSRIQNILYEKLERWFVKEADYVNNVLLAKVTGVNATSMEEKLAITNAYNYILSEIAPQFKNIVTNIIPPEHSMNTRMRMMFSGKFIVVSKILSNAGLYNESLKLYQLFNELFEEEYIAGEITNLSKLIKQDEQTRMAPHAASTSIANPALDEKSGLAPPAELGELEALEKERKKEFFKRNARTGIDYKEVIQGVLNNELRLVKAEEEQGPLIDKVLEEAAAEAEAEALKMRTAMEEMQRKHEQELKDKIDELNREYKASMKKWIAAIFVILVLTVSSVGMMIYEFSRPDVRGDLKSAVPVSSEAMDLEKTLKSEKGQIEEMESRLNEINTSIGEISRLYDESGEEQYAEQMADKQEEYNKLRTQYTDKVTEYNQHLKDYKALTE
ncbi:hypothetical protein [Aminipila luticellarii]|uniref:Uncharacterized protein n=1 Tax=Aminipila luticellarii TaxID=2507160 RepID=A0A410PWN0_9FIRM|nr:hypothetical protein [Aminipila luticellarii]QAT43352.1 hypothetical protein EQM06_09050 [Aminipila luticellarii]